MNERKVLEEIKNLENVQSLVQTYEEIAAGRMQRVKTSVLNNREFLAGLNEIFEQVTFSHSREIKELREKSKKSGSASVVARNGRTASVVLSANTGLYGGVIKEAFDLFVKETKDKKTDIVVVGRVGRSLFESVRKDFGERRYKYFDLPDSASKSEVFAEIISYIVKFEKVVVYHGKFESILSQVAVGESLTGDLPESEYEQAEKANYIFEPSISDIVGFFESEILASIFEQAMHEASLSKFASRMINLDKAVVNISESLKNTRFLGRRLHHRNINKKQLEMLSGMSLWG